MFEFTKRRFVLLFLVLVSTTLLYMAIMYDIPRNMHRFLTKERDPFFMESNNTLSRPGIEHNILYDTIYRHSFTARKPSTESSIYLPTSIIPNTISHEYLKTVTNGSSVARNKSELKKRLPSAIIIGSKKAGTRALLQFLGLHPSIQAANQEMHYFDQNYDSGSEWYLSKMPMTYPDEITVEKTPAYFVQPHVPWRINKLYQNDSKKLKFLLILINPVQRAISDYAQGLAQLKKKKRKKKAFESIVYSNEVKRKVNRQSSLINIGLYSNHLKRWLKYFDLKQFMFINGEMLIKKPWKELYRIQKFLNVSTFITKSNFWFNKTKNFYCVSTVTRQRMVMSRPHCLNDSKGRKHPYINPLTLSSLKKFYKPFNEKLYSMIGRNFGWDK